MPLGYTTNKYKKLLPGLTPPNMGGAGGPPTLPGAQTLPGVSGGTQPQQPVTPWTAQTQGPASPYTNALPKPGSQSYLGAGRPGSGPFNPLGTGPTPIDPTKAMDPFTAKPWLPTPKIPGQTGNPGDPTVQPPGPQIDPATLPKPTFTPVPAGPSQITMRDNPTAGWVQDPPPEAPVDMQVAEAPPLPHGTTYREPPAAYKVSNNVAGVGDTASFDKGPLTDLGGLYHDNIKRDLTSADNPYVRSIREGAQRLSDRNTYGATRGAEESLAQAGIQAGTSQYNRALAKATGGANEANLALMNDAAGQQRNFYQNALTKAGTYENDMFTRAKGERNTALETAKYGDIRADLQHTTDETKRLEGKGDALAFVNSIQDPKAQAAARTMYENGATTQQITAAIFDSYGAVGNKYRSASPGTVEAQGLLDRVTAALQGQVNPKTGQLYTDAEIKAKAAEYAVGGLENEYRPITEGTKKAEADAIVEKLRTGAKLTPEEETAAVKSGTIPEYTAANLPRGGGNQSVADLVGKPVNIGGKVYTVVKSDTTRTGAGTFTTQYRHTDWTEVKDQSGKSWYVYDGKLNEKPPKKIKSGWEF
jgi:hypothetical protein